MSHQNEDKIEFSFKIMFWAFAAGIIIMICFLFSSCQKSGPDHTQNAVKVANKVIIDSLQAEIVKKDSTINRLLTASKASVTKQQDISKSYKPIYEKISNDTSLASQLRYTQVLLAEHKITPLTRD